jgi:integrase
MGKFIKDALNDREIKSLKPKSKSYRVTDGEGLYLQIDPSGSKRWFLSFRLNEKRDRLAYGNYPYIGLADARELKRQDKMLIAKGLHPRNEKKKTQLEEQKHNANSVYRVTKEWFEINKSRWGEDHADSVWRKMESDVFPTLSGKSVHQVQPKDIVAVIQAIEARGAVVVANRVKQFLTGIFRLAVQKGYTEMNPAGDLRGALQPCKTNHHPYLPVEKLPTFFKRLKTYETSGAKETALAIRFMMNTFVRNKEMRFAKIDEFDLKWKVWRIPSERMKMDRPHVVPLNTQALAIVEELIGLAESTDGFIFPSTTDFDKPICSSTINRALRKMGYDTKTEVTTHGFRTTASSILNDSELWHPDAIERQLAHEEENEVRATYNNAKHLKQRVKMMNWWGDYLEGVENGSIDPMDMILGDVEAA